MSRFRRQHLLRHNEGNVFCGREAIPGIGGGKVGSVLARLWYAAGYNVSAIHSRTSTSAHVLAEATRAKVVESPEQVISVCNITVLTVPDDAISHVVATIKLEDLRNKAVIHSSGVHGIEVLQPLAERGALVGSIHPILPFAEIATAIQAVTDGITFAVEVHDALLQSWLLAMIKSLNGSILEVQPGKKALYHCAMVFASNYVVTLYAIAEQLLTEVGATRQDARNALDTLVGQTIENIQRLGVPDALTGPLVRGDVGTLTQHLSALEERHLHLAGLYRQLARASFPMLRDRNIDLGLIEQVLDRSISHADDRS